ncbi:hypothetical protein Efla_001171 [Eimeria flavescens]
MMRKAMGEGVAAALSCVSSASPDRRVSVDLEDQFMARQTEDRKRNEAFADAVSQGSQTPVTDSASAPRIQKTPSGLLGDPFQMRQWYLHSFFGNYTLAADRVWQELKKTSNAGEPVVIAVLDTGCFLHQDFIDGFDISESVFWENAGETDCTDGVDNDGNGYVDDCFGWNFVEDNAYPFSDDSGHGTLVTSVAAARAHDGRGGRGVALDPSIMCLKVGSRRGVWTSATIPALDYAIKMKARVSNHSYGGAGKLDAEYEAFVKALKHDHLVVTAAGNAGCNVDASDECFFTPGAFRLRGLLNVMASDISGFRAAFSNYGNRGVDVAAPGVNIYAGTNHRPYSGNTRCISCYTYCDGTSFAAPMVAAMAASLWKYFEFARPKGWRESFEKGSRKVEKAIMYSVTGSPALAGALGTNGVVNMWRAMRYYDSLPGPFQPEFPTPKKGYEPDFSGGTEEGSLRISASSVFLLLTLAAFALGAFTD